MKDFFSLIEYLFVDSFCSSWFFKISWA